MARTDRTAPCGIAWTHGCGSEPARLTWSAPACWSSTSKGAREFLTVSAGLAVLGRENPAASDSICCARLHRRHRGDDHRGAAHLLETATPDGKALATTLLRLLDVKDAAHYGVNVVATRKARDALKVGNPTRRTRPRRSRAVDACRR